MSAPDFQFCRRLTLVKALSILVAPSAMQRRLDVDPLGVDLQKGEVEVGRLGFAKYGYMCGVERTVEFTRTLARIFRAKEQAGHIDATNNRYDAKALIAELTMARQAIDRLCLPYDFFAVEALRYWVEQRRADTPSLGDLMQPDVVEYVTKRWADPRIRSSYPLDVRAWDQRFRSKRRVDTDQHRALRDVISQRVADVKAIGGDPAKALGPFLGCGMAEDVAQGRFGVDLVAEAKQPSDPLEQALRDL